MIIPIVLGVITLAVLVLAFLASKHWHWAHVLSVVAFYFATVGFILLAAQTLSLRLEWQEKYTTTEERLDETEQLVEAITYGTEDPSVANRLTSVGVEAPSGGDGIDGVIRARHELTLVNRARGRFWQFARPLGIDPQTRMVEVQFPFERQAPADPDADITGDAPAAPSGPPPALGMEVGAIVYVFEQGPPITGAETPPNQYLGEFRVDAVEGRMARLAPVDQLKLDPIGAQTYLNSQGPWIVYESMPSDRLELFAGFDEDLLRKLLPESTVEQYLLDGSPATDDTPPERRVGVDADDNVLPEDQIDQAVRQIYRRPIRDYSYLLDDLEKERAQLIARQQALTEDKKKLESAHDGAKELQAYRTDERNKWQADLAAVERDLAAVEKLVSHLQSQVANAKQLLAATLQGNARLAAVKAEQTGRLTPIGSGALDVDAL